MKLIVFLSLILCLSAVAQPNPLNRRAMSIAGLASSSLIPTANLLFWYKADAGTLRSDGSTVTTNGDTIHIWMDQSPNHYNLTNQAAATADPTNVVPGLNGLPYIEVWNNRSIAFTNGFNIGTLSAYTLFFVHRFRWNPAASNIRNMNVHQWEKQNGDAFYALRGEGNYPPVYTASSTDSGSTLTTNVWYQISDCFTLYRTNGIPVANYTLASKTVDHGWALWVDYNHDNMEVQDVGEVIGYSTDLAGTTTLTNIETYLKNKWGL